MSHRSISASIAEDCFITLGQSPSPGDIRNMRAQDPELAPFRILRRYVRHYNAARPHRGLSLMMPIARSEPNVDAVVRRHSVLGGIIHEYERAA
jgi:hypothetical protein